MYTVHIMSQNVLFFDCVFNCTLNTQYRTVSYRFVSYRAVYRIVSYRTVPYRIERINMC